MHFRKPKPLGRHYFKRNRHIRDMAAMIHNPEQLEDVLKSLPEGNLRDLTRQALAKYLPFQLDRSIDNAPILCEQI